MRILVKIGSALICRDNRVNSLWLAAKVSELSSLFREGHEILIVSSGAVAAGMEILGIRKRPKETLDLQLLSGQGQVGLFQRYTELFREKYIQTAQLLLTHHNFDLAEEVNTLTTIINAYLKKGVIPIINENDIINKEEFETERCFTDNDILAALVGCAVKVDKAVLLTNVDGLYDMRKAENKPDLKPVPEISDISEAFSMISHDQKSDLGLGGMYSKVQAAKKLTQAGIPAIIANGKYSIPDILENSVPRTLFLS